ncbi:MAG: ImmA/IrrE family metallo-endopeptidase [Deltaproteobacteria bacterium]|nr:ImmA/IrrE family metallo-endopeptidase [Deltaproteobacteria bacterium]
MRSLDVGRARQAARRILERAGVVAPDQIDLEQIARRHGATVVVGPLEGATARLIRVGTGAVIRVSDRVTHPGARRFSIAHELGHLVLGHVLPRPDAGVADWAIGAAHLRQRGRGEVDPEVEANAFAAELLIPEALARRRCEVSPVDLTPARGIAREFRTSLVASAVRFVELASERCAVVFAERGRVQWAVPSATFTADIPRGVPLDRASVAHDYMRKGAIDDAPQAVPAAAWIDDPTGEVEVIEHATVLDDLGAVLAMLWVPETAAAQLSMTDA